MTRRAALYSGRDRSPGAARPGGTRENGAASSDGSEDVAAPSLRARLAGMIRRHERVALFAAAVAIGALATSVFWLRQPAPREYTQEDIDAAVMHTVETKALPSQAARAADAVRQSVVRVNGYTDEPVDDDEDAEDREGMGRKGFLHPRERKDDPSGRPAREGRGGKAGPDPKSRADERRAAKDAGPRRGAGKDAKPGEDESPKVAERRTRVGTGVVIVDNGTILTNLHVVAGAKRVTVTFYDGSESEVQFMGAQPENDLAVIRARIIPDDLPSATLGSSGNLRPGDEVTAVGFPFGIGPSVSSGVVSGLNREFGSPEGKRKLQRLIQFDAAVNPGNSGGPLVNSMGEVVGIVTALLNPSEQRTFIGIGFAVTIESAGSAVGIPPF